MVSELKSWGRTFPSEPSSETVVQWLHELSQVKSSTPPILAYGMGRSYGDSCLNNGGSLVVTRNLRRLIHFDESTGLLRCESGMTLGEILEFAVPRGWFIPVSPGTQFVTVGGAIANDVHGKNHHRVGTFGCHVHAFELVRSNGEKLTCSREENTDYFAATIGGLGLTGLMSWCEVYLKKSSPWLEVEQIRFRNLEEFFSLSEESDKDWEYTVSWIDCVNAWSKWGRGIFMRGNHLDHSPDRKPPKQSRLAVPFEAPNFILNRWTVKAFNDLYYHRLLRDRSRSQVFYQPFFYPLDSINHWNLIYGSRGFYQFQFVIANDQKKILYEIFEKIASSGQASFLAVLKQFGSTASPGMLSFPREGYTLTLDFANKGEKTANLLRTLTSMVRSVGGRLYPAKDSTMTADDFHAFYPNLSQFTHYLDPAFSSSFWRRVQKPQSESA